MLHTYYFFMYVSSSLQKVVKLLKKKLRPPVPESGSVMEPRGKTVSSSLPSRHAAEWGAMEDRRLDLTILLWKTVETLGADISHDSFKQLICKLQKRLLSSSLAISNRDAFPWWKFYIKIWWSNILIQIIHLHAYCFDFWFLSLRSQIEFDTRLENGCHRLYFDHR